MGDESTQVGALVFESRQPMEKRILALDALSKLTRQFCYTRDFEHLIDILLMTLCGQFSVADSFALLRKPSSQAINQSFFATGRFKKEVLLTSLQLATDQWRPFSQGAALATVVESGESSATSDVLSILRECGVTVVCPLYHNEDIIGIIGLGGRVNGKSYDQDDIDLLGTVLSTLTPLLANSYLFWEIASLNAWYIEILNSVRQGVFVFDRNYRLKKVNSAGLAILRASGFDGSFQDALEDAPIDSVFPESVFGGLAKEIVGTRVMRQSNTSARVVARKGDSERIYNVNITATMENADIGTALIITLDDVTVQKEAEERLFDLQKFADKGLMASSISHELNNFLTLVLGGVELMELALEQGDGEKVSATLDKIKTNIGNLERFTAGLTDAARLESTKQSASFNSIITDLLSFLPIQRRFKRIAITSDLDTDLPDLEVDANQIAQLLLNLFNNAADAVKDMEQEDAQIAIRTFRDDDHLVLSVSDNGVGMSPDVKEKLFTSQFTTKQDGHGYGLVTCAKIIENHNATVDVDSAVGGGTTFNIRFPVPGNT
jgi:signal transduction histidine kinase